MYHKLGRLFQKIARFFFARASGFCWNCGTYCGFNSTMARGYLWCNYCYERWQFVITDFKYVFSIRHFGYPVGGLTKRAADKAHEWACKECNKPIGADGHKVVADIGDGLVIVTSAYCAEHWQKLGE